MNLLKEYRNVIIYLLRFVFLYIVFIKFYEYYLSFFKDGIDPFTRLTANSVKEIYRIFNLSSEVIPTENEGIKLLVNGKYVARIVEGCNAISLIILFMVFLLAFWKFSRPVLRFLVMGILSIFILNVLRIDLLGYILYAYPAYQDFWHKVVFPGIIYSWIVLLWIFFIKKYFGRNE